MESTFIELRVPNKYEDYLMIYRYFIHIFEKTHVTKTWIKNAYALLRAMMHHSL